MYVCIFRRMFKTVAMVVVVVVVVGNGRGCMQSHRPAIGPWQGRDGEGE